MEDKFVEFKSSAVIGSLIVELKSKGLLKELIDDIEFSIFELPNGHRLGYQGGAYFSIYEIDNLIFTHKMCDLSKIQIGYYEDRVTIEFFKYGTDEFIDTYTCYTRRHLSI